MIVRKQPNGEMILVGQTEHSRLVGQLAAHWGNEKFAVPEPFDSMARLAAFHDYGWLRYETSPLFNQETGDTPEFRQVPPSPLQLEAYEWCHDWLLAPDPLASLVANMHRTGLFRGRYGTIKHPQAFTPPKGIPPALEAFVVKNEARQERERGAFDPQQLHTNYRLLQVWDLLGLYFGCQDPCDDYIEPVPVTYDDREGEGVRLTMHAITPRKVAFDPYPFDARQLHVQMSYKTLPKSVYPDAESFRKDYFKAPLQLMEFELV
jgi:hypothetical protein